MDLENNTSKNKSELNTSRSSVGKLIEFLDKYLPEFPALFEKKTNGTNIQAEDDISQEVWEYLQAIAHHTRKIFMFQFQRKERGSNRSSDFGVLIVKPFNSNPSREFFRIEAKRLPTGYGKREKEYVEGNSGGIERYKRGHHGKDLSQSAIIGYIQKEDSSHWHTKLNQWINDLISNNVDEGIHWDSQDLLIEIDTFKTTKKYSSKNTRIVNSITDSIQLHHYLMQLS